MEKEGGKRKRVEDKQPTSKRARTMPRFNTGDIVEIFGLKNEYNGKQGILEVYREERNCWDIQVGEQLCLVHAKNIRQIEKYPQVIKVSGREGANYAINGVYHRVVNLHCGRPYYQKEKNDKTHWTLSWEPKLQGWKFYSGGLVEGSRCNAKVFQDVEHPVLVTTPWTVYGNGKWEKDSKVKLEKMILTNEESLPNPEQTAGTKLQKPEKKQTEVKKTIQKNEENEKSFECHNCMKNRYVSFTPKCGHGICGPCVVGQNGEKKCKICKANFQESASNENSVLHNIKDLTEEEFFIAVLIAFLGRENQPLAKQIIEKKIGIDETDPENWDMTLVWLASSTGQLELVKLLAENGADLNKENVNGSSPVWIAASEGHLEVVKYLAQKGVKLNTTNNARVTPVWAAAFNGHLKVVKFLKDSGADLHKAANGGTTPADVAAEKGHNEIVEFLKCK